MSDRESSRGIESSLKKRRKNDEFAQSIASIAVAQVCESVGLQGFQQSALDILSDITCKYIQNIGKTSNFYANLASRTEGNALDVIHGLEDLSLVQGFAGASDINHCLLGSGIIKEISQYIAVSEEIGFAYSVPSFPVIKERYSTVTPSFLQAGETPLVDNIPAWLPCFPEETETSQEKVDQDQNVFKLQQRLACNGSEAPLVVEMGNNGRREQVSNPFLAAPLRAKGVSLVSLPAMLVEEDVALNRSLWVNHVSALATFAPVIHGVKSSDLDNEEGSKKILIERRPAMQLKFHRGKKSLATADRHNKTGNMEVLSWFVNDDLRDDTKRGKEKIMKESMENGEHTGMIEF